MYKVLIVDDEHYVVSLIERIIDWQALNMCIAGTADNGQSAIALVEKLEPDIMIVDVRMPGCDGITLMQRVREINSRIKFIVISGHRRFEYAKSAMKYNVEDYLLKPINKDELEGILRKLREKLEQESASLQTIQVMDSQLGESKERLRALLLEHILAGEPVASKLSQINREYLTEFSPGRFCCVIIKLDSGNKELDRSFFSELLQELAEVLTGDISPACYSCLSLTQAKRILVLLNYASSREEELYNRLRQSAKGMGGILEKYEKLRHTLGVGDSVKDLSEISFSLSKAQKALDSRFELNSGIIFFREVREDAGIINIILSDQRTRKLSSAFQSLNCDRIHSCIYELFAISKDYGKSDTAISIRLTRQIHHIFFEYIRRIDVYKGSYEDLYAALWEQLEVCFSKEELQLALTEHIRNFIETYIAKGTNPVVRIAKQYILENYDKSISLSSISEIVNLTPVYFSILFKKEVGINFVDYLTQYRIETAKGLLKDVRHNINEVASLCGFQDTRYFSKTFKKIVGITPSEYRSRHIS